MEFGVTHTQQHVGGPTSTGSASHRHPIFILSPPTSPHDLHPYTAHIAADCNSLLRIPASLATAVCARLLRHSAHLSEKTTVSSRLPTSIDRRLHRSTPSLAGVPTIGAPTAADYPLVVTCFSNLIPEFCCRHHDESATGNHASGHSAHSLPPPSMKASRQSTSSLLRPLHSTSTRPTTPSRLQRHGR
ncbi:mast/stem cell growth factor receptor Kit, partial [Striga asiatica]